MKWKAAPTAVLAVAILGTVLTFATAEVVVPRNHSNHSFTFEERGEIVSRLYRLGLENKPEHIPVFCAALASEDALVQEAAIKQLVFTHDDSVIEPVTNLMQDPSTVVRRCAIAVLEKVGSQKAVPALREALSYVPPLAGTHSEADAQPPLRQEEYFNRLAAALALHRLGYDDGAGMVLALLKERHTHPVLQMAIKAALVMELEEATPDLIAIARKCESFGEDSPGFHALRALRIMGDPSYGEEILQLAMDKYQTPGGFVKIETLHLMVELGDERVLPIFRAHLEAPEDWIEHDYLIVEGLRKLRPPDAAPLLVEGILTPSEVDPSTGEIQHRTASRVFQLAAMGVVEAGDATVLPDLKVLYRQYRAPVDHFPFRLYLAYAMAGLGDSFGLDELFAALRHEDAAVRRISAKLLGLLRSPRSLEPLTAALEKETDRAAFKSTIASLRQMASLTPDLAARPTPPEPPVPVDIYGKPRYVHFTFDDCNTIEAMERFVGLMEELAQQGVRWVYTMYVAANARHDFEYLTVLLQRCFDRGCEIENHTLHHNPDGQHIMARTPDEVRLDIGGGANWLHSHIMGLDKMYAWKAGGGGFRRPGDPTLTREDVWRLGQEAYWAKDVAYDSYGGRGNETFRMDLYAPPYHPLSALLRSPRGTGDLYCQYDADTAAELINAYVSSFDCWYFSNPEQVLVISGHDFPNSPIPIRIGHSKHWDVLSGFIREVLVSRRDHYPQAYSVTALELCHVEQRGLTPDDILNREEHLQNSTDF
jgi:HEAT repeat protein